VIAALAAESAAHLRSLRRQPALPPLPPRVRKRGRKPHDPRCAVRTALYDATGVDLPALEGSEELHAWTLVSELASDFTKWPPVKHFPCWLGLCPNWQKTGGQVKSSRVRHGMNREALALRRAAWRWVRRPSYLGAYLRRQRSRLGAPKALTAPAHQLARIISNLMRFGVAYLQQTEEAYAAPVRERLEQQWHRRARELGYPLTKIEPAAAAAAA
jgi:hypothetical protein